MPWKGEGEGRGRGGENGGGGGRAGLEVYGAEAWTLSSFSCKTCRNVCSKNASAIAGVVC